ncbi:MAG: hypothetical protein JW850_02055 [Thermoflexales bacterium]|nr:hypothetical protein [Thermoflexales bacterium]
MDDGLRRFDDKWVGVVRELGAIRESPLHEARPSLEYQHVFDLCALQAQRGGGPVLLVASSAFYAGQLLARLEGCQVQIQVTGASQSPVTSDTILWAEPELEGGEHAARQLARLLARDGRLYVLASGWSVRFLPEWRCAGSRPAAHPAGLRRTRTWLRQAGLAVEAVYGFHSPASAVWTWVAGLADSLGRADLADRCLAQMRASYVSRGWPALATPVRMVVAKWT